MSKNPNPALRRVCGISLISLSLFGTARLAQAEPDSCGWQGGMVSAALIAGLAYFFPGGEDAAGLFTAVAGGYGVLDYLKTPCPPQTQDLPCADSLAGCEDLGGPSDSNSPATSPQPQPQPEDDGSQS